MESVHELIEKRAYELFLARGGENGYAIQDWAIAEKEILAQVDKERRAAAIKSDKKEAAPVPQAVPAPKAASFTPNNIEEKNDIKKKTPVKKTTR